MSPTQFNLLGLFLIQKGNHMAHEVETMAFRNATPWHGLGNRLPEGQSIEQWRISAGMDWEIFESPVMYPVGTFSGVNFRSFPENKVLFRSDSQLPLSVVSKRYQVVQPAEILDFYKGLVSAGGFELETAGVLKGGKKIFALAKTDQSTQLKGKDTVKAYLLLATSCDGTLATQAMFTSVRVVCSNTLQLAVNGDNSGVVKVPHSRCFDPAEVKSQLGLGLSGWDSFQRNIKALAARPVSEDEARRYLVQVLGDPSLPDDEQPRTIKAVHDLYSGLGKGSQLPSSKQTAWGLVNAVTDWLDHSRQAKSPDHRIDSALFGQGASLKVKAFQEALALTA
jgi:phage/plasmid-like protein (TIGR03299 family)